MAKAGGPDLTMIDEDVLLKMMRDSLQVGLERTVEFVQDTFATRLRQSVREYLSETDNNPAFKHYLDGLEETAIADALRGNELPMVELAVDSRKTQEILLKNFWDTHLSDLKDKDSNIATIVDRIFLDEFAASRDKESPGFTGASNASRTIGDVTVKMCEVLKGEDHPLNQFAAREEFKSEFEEGKTFPIAINGTALSYPSDGRFIDDLPQLIVLADEYQKLQKHENNVLADYITYDPKWSSLSIDLNRQNIPAVYYGVYFAEITRGETPSFTENRLNHEFTHFQAGHLSPESMIYKTIKQLGFVNNPAFEIVTQNPSDVYMTLLEKFDGDHAAMASYIDQRYHIFSQVKGDVAAVAHHVKNLPSFKQSDGEEVGFTDLDGTVIAADMLRGNHILSHILKAPSLQSLRSRMFSIEYTMAVNAMCQSSPTQPDALDANRAIDSKLVLNKLQELQSKHSDLAENVKLLRDDCLRHINHAVEYEADLGMVERAQNPESALRVLEKFAEWEDQTWIGIGSRPSARASHTHPASTDRVGATRVFIEEVQSVRGTTVEDPQQRRSLQAKLTPKQNTGRDL